VFLRSVAGCEINHEAAEMPAFSRVKGAQGKYIELLRDRQQGRSTMRWLFREM